MFGSIQSDPVDNKKVEQRLLRLLDFFMFRLLSVADQGIADIDPTQPGIKLSQPVAFQSEAMSHPRQFHGLNRNTGLLQSFDAALALRCVAVIGTIAEERFRYLCFFISLHILNGCFQISKETVDHSVAGYICGELIDLIRAIGTVQRRPVFQVSEIKQHSSRCHRAG